MLHINKIWSQQYRILPQNLTILLILLSICNWVVTFTTFIMQKQAEKPQDTHLCWKGSSHSFTNQHWHPWKHHTENRKKKLHQNNRNAQLHFCFISIKVISQCLLRPKHASSYSVKLALPYFSNSFSQRFNRHNKTCRYIYGLKTSRKKNSQVMRKSL